MQDQKPKILTYQIPKKYISIEVRIEEETVWLTPFQIAELFEISLCEILRYIAFGLLIDSFKTDNNLVEDDFKIVTGDKDNSTINYLSLNAIRLIGFHFNRRALSKFEIWAYRHTKMDKIENPGDHRPRFSLDEEIWIHDENALREMMDLYLKLPPEGPSLN